MGKPITAAPVKLIIGLLFSKDQILIKTERILKRSFGRTDFESGLIHFSHTDHYEKEMGAGLKRKFLSFEKLILPCELSKIKTQTNKIEKRLSINSLRQVNIDPGYLDLAKLVLASTKDYCHRIYLDRGIYAEVTLRYQGDSFRGWDWSYPDYKTPEYLEIFGQIRKLYYASQLKTPKR
jgi:hypothetical protein